jgi:hypothetical protein
VAKTDLRAGNQARQTNRAWRGLVRKNKYRVPSAAPVPKSERRTPRTDRAGSALKLSRKEKSLAAAGSCGAENRGREKPVAKMKRASQSGARTKKISVEKNRERKHHQIWDERYLKKRRDSKTEDLLTEKRKSMTRKAPGRNLVQSRASSDPAKLKREKEK